MFYPSFKVETSDEKGLSRVLIHISLFFRQASPNAIPTTTPTSSYPKPRPRSARRSPPFSSRPSRASLREGRTVSPVASRPLLLVSLRSSLSARSPFYFGSFCADVLDIYVSSALTSAHLVSIAPYHPSLTSPLLFGSYSALHALYIQHLSTSSLSTTYLTTAFESATLDAAALQPSPSEDDDEALETIGSSLELSSLPVLVVIESRSHPAATRNSPAWPAYPQDVVSVGSGKDVEEFKGIWEREVREAAAKEETDS